MRGSARQAWQRTWPGPLDVIGPVIVAALGNGNDIVILIDTVDDQGATSFVSIATIRSSSSIPRA